MPHKYKMINKVDKKKGKKRLLNMINSERLNETVLDLAGSIKIN